MSKIENFEMEITTLKRMRTVWVYLPDNYDEKGDGFPVIYMHDGQNLFYDRLTAYGAAWHVDKVLDEIYRTTGMSCIVVGVECSDKVRFSEYSPWKAAPFMRHRPKEKDNLGGEGEKYAQWFADTLKPYVDNRYNTDKQREATAVAGSSMGGLISCYIGLKYQPVYETMGLFSTYTAFNKPAFNRFEMTTRQTLPQHAYIYAGGKEWGEQGQQSQQRDGFDSLLSLQQTVCTRRVLRVDSGQRIAPLRNGVGNLLPSLCGTFFAALLRVQKETVRRFRQIVIP